MSQGPDPFTEIEEFVDEFVGLGDPMGRQIPVDMVDRDKKLVVRADLPGRDPAGIDVQLLDSRKLVIGADAVGDGEDDRYVTRERTTGATDRTLRLPAAVDEAETEASYDDGVLTVHLPKLSGTDDGTDIEVN